MEISLRIILRKPTAGVDFGLQKGRGSKYEVVQKQRSTGENLKFEFAVGVKTGKDGAPDFSGPFVQGARGDRYFYIDIGTYAGQENTCWSRRLKVPLSCITPDLINSSSTLIADIPGTARDGGPSCAYAWLKCLDRPWHWRPSEPSAAVPLPLGEVR
ncbi:MAG TPA: DUF5990 family protein [Pyrinomonadaceae bacterium]|nr:DUF5990 family protein [Pyrinomonadaceae bacterium]